MTEKRTDYAEDQPRDEHGRFGFGDGGARIADRSAQDIERASYGAKSESVQRDIEAPSPHGHVVDRVGHFREREKLAGKLAPPPSAEELSKLGDKLEHVNDNGPRGDWEPVDSAARQAILGNIRGIVERSTGIPQKWNVGELKVERIAGARGTFVEEHTVEVRGAPVHDAEMGTTSIPLSFAGVAGRITVDPDVHRYAVNALHSVGLHMRPTDDEVAGLKTYVHEVCHTTSPMGLGPGGGYQHFGAMVEELSNEVMARGVVERMSPAFEGRAPLEGGSGSYQGYITRTLNDIRDVGAGYTRGKSARDESSKLPRESVKAEHILREATQNYRALLPRRPFDAHEAREAFGKSLNDALVKAHPNDASSDDTEWRLSQFRERIAFLASPEPHLDSIIESVWQLARNDVPRAMAYVTSRKVSHDAMAVIIQLQDDPSELIGRLRALDALDPTRFDGNDEHDDKGRFTGPGGGGSKSSDDIFKEIDAKIAARKEATESYIAKNGDKPFQSPSRDGWQLAVTKDPSKPTQWRVTRFEDGTPVGHTEAKTFRDAIDVVYDFGGKVPTGDEGRIDALTSEATYARYARVELARLDDSNSGATQAHEQDGKFASGEGGGGRGGTTKEEREAKVAAKEAKEAAKAKRLGPDPHGIRAMFGVKPEQLAETKAAYAATSEKMLAERAATVAADKAALPGLHEEQKAWLAKSDVLRDNSGNKYYGSSRYALEQRLPELAPKEYAEHLKLKDDLRIAENFSRLAINQAGSTAHAGDASNLAFLAAREAAANSPFQQLVEHAGRIENESRYTLPRAEAGRLNETMPANFLSSAPSAAGNEPLQAAFANAWAQSHASTRAESLSGQISNANRRIADTERPLKPADITQRYFDDRNLGKLHNDITNAWVGSSSSPGALALHGALAAEYGMAFEGLSKHAAGVEKGDTTCTKSMAHDMADKAGVSYPELVRYTREMYLVSQATLPPTGFKDDKFHLYRGIHNQSYAGAETVIDKPKWQVGSGDRNPLRISADTKEDALEQARLHFEKLDKEPLNASTAYQKDQWYVSGRGHFSQRVEAKTPEEAKAVFAFMHPKAPSLKAEMTRGASAPYATMPNSGDNHHFDMRPAASWSDQRARAKNFSEHGHRDGLILSERIDPTRIYAHHALFKNSLKENEFVALSLPSSIQKVSRPKKGRYDATDDVDLDLDLDDEDLEPITLGWVLTDEDEDWLRIQAREGKPETRTDDWNEELHPRDHGRFALSEGDKAAGHQVSLPRMGDQLHRIPITHAALFNEAERAGKPDASREAERATFNRVLELPVNDARAEALARPYPDTPAITAEAQAVKEGASRDELEAVAKFTNGFDQPMRALDEGQSFSVISERTEAHWNEKLEAQGYDLAVEREQPGDGDTQLPGLANLYMENFGHADGAEHTQEAEKAMGVMTKMFENTPSTPGLAYRGLKDLTPQTLERILDSRTFALDSVTSFSQSHPTAVGFARPSNEGFERTGTAAVFPDGFCVVLRVAHDSGLDISAMSSFKSEREVLIPKDTSFRITAISRSDYTPKGSRTPDGSFNHVGEPPIVFIDAVEVPHAED